MEHQEASKRMAVEGYLLGELSSPELDEFEEHLASCAQCMVDVETGVAFVANTRAVFDDEAQQRTSLAPEPKQGWFATGRLRFVFWQSAPLAACAALVLVTGYQNLVQIPGLRRQGAGDSVLALKPSTQVVTARAAQGRVYSKADGAISLSIAHEWQDPYVSYTSRLERRADGGVVLHSASVGAPGDLAVSIPTAHLEAGAYVLKVYGLPAGAANEGGATPVAEFPFTLTNQEQK